jgi:hypothetical protein
MPMLDQAQSRFASDEQSSLFRLSVNDKGNKVFNIGTIGQCYKAFSSIFTTQENKWECLSLALFLFGLVWCLRVIPITYRCHNIQHNDIQHTDTQHDDTQHNDTQHNDT